MLNRACDVGANFAYSCGAEGGFGLLEVDELAQ